MTFTMDDLFKLIGGGVVTAVVTYAFYRLKRRSDKYDLHCKQFVDDLNKLMDLVGNAGRACAAHQAGNVTTFRSLNKSREAATGQRKQAKHLQQRLCSMLALETDKQSWKLNHLTWVVAIDCETGLITDSDYKWSAAEVATMEQATADYNEWLTRLRSSVTSISSKKLSFC